ncbi:MAG: YfcC family protein [Oscillospiraceae bacterium]|nr:YfcC family protein [Oscillospiraceae bacterium]
MENTEKKEKKKFQFKMPHTYVILISIMVLMLVLTHIIPAGEYDRVEDPVSGKMVVVADSYHEIDVEAPGIFDLFLALQEGYVDAANIMFLIIFAYGFVYVLTKNGTMDAALGTMVRKIGSRVSLLIPITMLVLGILGSTMGIYEEVYGLFPVFVGIFMALGYDAIVGGAIIFLGVSIGYAAGTTNPYNIAVAQDVAGVELYSGMEFRWLIFIAFEALAIFYVMRYARRVKADPARSLLKGIAVDSVEMKGINSLDEVKMTTRQKLCLLEFFGVIGFLTYSVLELGWYVNEIAALFLMAMVIAGIISGYSATEICKTFIESTKSMVSSMLIVGFTRGILILMKQGCITDTIVYGLVNVLDGASKYVAAYGMLFLQNIIKFFINGSTSQATITMPIMAPTAELVGLSKQIAVLAYQFGNGFADCFWPTSCALCCGLMGGVPLNKWYRFVTPLFLMMLVLEFVFMTIAVWIGY